MVAPLCCTVSTHTHMYIYVCVYVNNYCKKKPAIPSYLCKESNKGTIPVQFLCAGRKNLTEASLLLNNLF